MFSCGGPFSPSTGADSTVSSLGESFLCLSLGTMGSGLLNEMDRQR